MGTARADIVAVEARRIAQDHDHQAGLELEVVTTAAGAARPAQVVSLTQRRLTDPDAVIAGLPADSRPLPSVAGYDELLARRTPPPTPTTSTAAAGGPTSNGQVS